MQTMEFFILNWIQANCRCAFLDALMPAVSALCSHGEIWIALALVLLLIKRTRKLGAVMAVALVLDVVCCNLLLKPLVGRLRPCVVNPAVTLLVAIPTDASFPSGHTASSFAAVSALLSCRSKLWRPAFALALLIAFSRLYLYVHWPSDVLGGAVLGTLLGFWTKKAVDWADGRIIARR